LPKHKNYEIKTPISNFNEIRSIVKNLSGQFKNKKSTMEYQKDIYFRTLSGRLKLRVINNRFGELIFYNRKESKKLRVSKYIISKTEDYKNLNAILSNFFKVVVIVEKIREIYIFDNIRIHLDKVKNLGEFLEFEIIYNDFNKVKKQMKLLIDYFNLDKHKFINHSYSDLLLEKNKLKGK
jgi:predicted adenylyl cyclase CyaB